jgi:hypothetical protein
MAVASPARKTAADPPAGLQTFVNESDRVRLTGTALRAYRALAERWRFTNAEAASLLGVSGSTWDRIKRDGRAAATLSQDQLTRISALTGIFKGLHLLFAGEMADRWPRLANSGPLFGGQTPVDAMIDGGIPVMIEVRRHIDAVRGGL